MSKGIGLMVLICLVAAPLSAQMGGGMMGGGMMGPGWMSGNRGPLNQPQGSQGSEIYGMLCSRCHRAGGTVIYPNLPLRGAPQLSDFNTFLNFIRNPRMPDGSVGPMPPFPPDRISEAQARELYDYLVNWLGKPQSTPGMGPPMTEDRAKQEVERYLKAGANPNLKVGEVQDKGEAYEVEIVTRDGSLVDKILVNKKTGSMRSVY
jgi:mono/diheme cytochrome c family protein